MPKILVVSNDNYTIQSIKYVFPGKDFTIISTNDADKAIEIAWKERPNLVITDMALSELTGLEILGILKKNELTNCIHFVILSNKSNPEDEIKAFNLGVLLNLLILKFSRHE